MRSQVLAASALAALTATGPTHGEQAAARNAAAAVAMPSIPPAPASPEPAPAPSPSLSQFPDLRSRLDRLTLENGITEQTLRKQLAALTAEKQRLELENALKQQKLDAELEDLDARIQRLNRETALLDKQFDLEARQRRAKLDRDLAESRDRAERLRAANDLAVAELATKNRELQQKDAELNFRQKELQVHRAEFDLEVAKLNSEIDLWEKRQDLRSRVPRAIEYTTEPFRDGVLTISDRRIALNGPIMMDTADYVAERIDYFNNQSAQWPIFIVIDSSPGGSVMAGYKILKAMEGSPAPVYVVVKSFAASMAAGIATLARQSFAYPNAIILHHQLLGGAFGNVAEQKERMKELDEWWRRLATPVAQKMGITLDEFVKRMYANTITGDWREFGDNAVKLKWVDHTAQTIREQSLVKNPDREASARPRVSPLPAMTEKVDADGRRYVELPRLEPFDAYYLYNPDGYYRPAR